MVTISMPNIDAKFLKPKFSLVGFSHCFPTMDPQPKFKHSLMRRSAFIVCYLTQDDKFSGNSFYTGQL